MIDFNPDDVLNWFNDPWTGIVVALVVVVIAIGVMYSRQALIDLIQGKWR